MKLLMVIAVGVALVGCSSIDMQQYRDRTPVLDLYSYFRDETTGWGMVQDRNGLLLRQFVVRIQGSVTANNELVLEEDFVWSDGELQRRTWKITADGKQKLRGTAEDVVGVASGEISGNVLRWNYYLNVKVDDATYAIHLDDWMFLQPDNVLINKTKMSKFGIPLGEVTIVFTKKA